MAFPKFVVGWLEWVALPDLQVPAIRAKIDTGAKTSSIHAYNIKMSRREGQTYVAFDLHPIRGNHTISRHCEMPVIDKRVVKSSSGDREKRPVILTKLKIGGFTMDIELNLTNRDTMGYRMLLGREALRLFALVNPASAYLHGKLSTATILKRYQDIPS